MVATQKAETPQDPVALVPAMPHAIKAPCSFEASTAKNFPDGPAAGTCDDWLSIGFLCICYALNVGTLTAAIAAICLTAKSFAPGPAAETLPLACIFYFQGVTQAGLPFEFRRLGRRGSFLLGTASGIVGCMLVVFAAWIKLFSLVCISGCLQGSALAHAMNYRFVAISLAPSKPPKAIAWILSGGVFGAILGPGVFSRAQGLLSIDYAGIFVLCACAHVCAGVVLCFVCFPEEGTRGIGQASSVVATKSRPLKEIFVQPKCWAASIAISASYVIMMLTMAPTPLVMPSRFGHSFDETTMVMMSHMISMYAPSLITSKVVSRFGTMRVMVAGCVALVLSAISLLASGMLIAFFIGLSLLGLGWNFLFLSGTTQLATCYQPCEGPKVQAVNDGLLALNAASASLLSALIVDTIGWGKTQAVVVMSSLATFIAIASPLILKVTAQWYAVDEKYKHDRTGGVKGQVVGKV